MDGTVAVHDTQPLCGVWGPHCCLGRFVAPGRLLSGVVWRMSWGSASPCAVSPFQSFMWAWVILLGWSLAWSEWLQSSEGDIKADHTHRHRWYLLHFFQWRGSTSSALTQTYVTWETEGIRSLCTAVGLWFPLGYRAVVKTTHRAGVWGWVEVGFLGGTGRKSEEDRWCTSLGRHLNVENMVWMVNPLSPCR